MTAVATAKRQRPLQGAGNGAGQVFGASIEGLRDRRPDPSQSFATFVVGACNEFAFKAARRLTEVGESEIGLLFIHGGFGYGKTHLLNALAIESHDSHRSRVLFLRAEDFMRRFLAALRSQETLSFKEELRGADTLVIDDLQHICGRAATSSEFLHTVKAFTDLRRKVVIAADRPPAMLEGVSDDIRSRLQGAVVIALEKPDAATRLAMLKAKAAEMEKKCPRARVSEAVLQQVTNELDGSPREILGVLIKLATYADLTGKPITAEIAQEAIGTRATEGDRHVTFGTSRASPRASTAGRHVSRPRTHQPFAARYRKAFWRPRPYDGVTCLPAYR
jgi:chromosomal replication initiator protein